MLERGPVSNDRANPIFRRRQRAAKVRHSRVRCRPWPQLHFAAPHARHLPPPNRRTHLRRKSNWSVAVEVRSPALPGGAAGVLVARAAGAPANSRRLDAVGASRSGCAQRENSLGLQFPLSTGTLPLAPATGSTGEFRPLSASDTARGPMLSPAITRNGLYLHCRFHVSNSKIVACAGHCEPPSAAVGSAHFRPWGTKTPLFRPGPKQRPWAGHRQVSCVRHSEFRPGPKHRPWAEPTSVRRTCAMRGFDPAPNSGRGHVSTVCSKKLTSCFDPAQNSGRRQVHTPNNRSRFTCFDPAQNSGRRQF